MSYYFYLGDFMLPVPPSRMDISVNNKNKTVSLINEGEINIIKTPGLKEIAFDALFPNTPYPFADYSRSFLGDVASYLTSNRFAYRPAAGFLDGLEAAKADKNPLRFIVTRLTASFVLLFDTNFLVTVEDFTLKEDAREGYDAVVALKLKEWRDYGTKQVTVTQGADGAQTVAVSKTRQTDRSVPKAWTVTGEKSVYEAVKLASGGGLDWRTVALSLNGNFNPFEIIRGQVLRFE